MPASTDFDINAWEAGKNNHAQGEDFDIHKWEGSQAPQAPAARAQLPEGQLPLTGYGNATLQGLANVGQGVIDTGKGIVSTFDPRPKEGENVLTANPAARMVRGILQTIGQAPQVPGAIRDIANSEDPLGTASSVVGQTAGGVAGQVIAGATTEGLAENPQSAVTAGRVVKAAVRGGAKLADIAAFERLSKAGKVIRGTAGEIRDALNTDPEIAPPASPQPQSAPSTKTVPSASAESTPAAPQSQSVITDPEAIKAKLKELSSVSEKGTTVAEKSTPANGKSAATRQKIADETAELRNRPTTVAGKPVNPDTDFTQALKDTLARLGKGEAGSLGMPGSITDADEGIADIRSQPIIKQMEGEVPARGFLNRVGADEASVAKTDANMGKDYDQRVQYQREQYKKGTMKPVELHLDEDNNDIGADGRHRAIAAIHEGGANAKIKVRIVKHRFQSVSQ